MPYRSYGAHQAETEALIRSAAAGQRLEWRKGKVRPISHEKLAALYWAMRHSQGQSPMTRFSYQQAHVALRQAINATAHRNEMAAMLRALEQMGLVERVGGYWPGRHGQGWRVSHSVGAGA